MNKILIIQTAFLGDVILSLPLIETLKMNHPDVLVDFLCIPYTAEILRNNHSINEVIVYDKHGEEKKANKNKSIISGIREIAKILKKRNYDMVIIPHRSTRSALISLLAGIPVRIGFKKPFYEWMYTKTMPYQSHIHEIERNLTLLDGFAILSKEKVPKIYPLENDFKLVESLFNEYKINKSGNKIIALAPGSIWITKRWLIEYYRVLCNLLAKENYFVLIIGGKNDISLANLILVNNSSKIINLCGRLNITQTAALLVNCNLLISNDSAPVHIASATNTPVIDIYGPTVPSIGFYPISSTAIILEDKSLNCRPCGVHGGKKCPVRSFDCMKNITPERVFSAVNEIFQSNEEIIFNSSSK